MKYLPLWAAVFLSVFSACEERDKSGKVLDTPTTGQLRIMVDESYRPIISSAIDVFDSIYNRAKLEAVYVSEGEAINAVLRDSIQLIIIPRKLTDEELKFFKQRGFTPPMTAIAHDAIAFIVHPDNPDTTLTTQQLASLLSGKAPSWKDVDAKSTLGPVQLVFDNPLSGTVRYAQDSIAGGAPLPSNASALKTNQEVIEYVGKHKGALGIIGANIISDADDQGVQKFLGNIRPLRIAKNPGERGFGPWQAYLMTGQYPYKRTVYVINAQARKGLGLGFASFLAGDTGQRMFQKEGMLPAQAPTRLMQFSRE